MFADRGHGGLAQPGGWTYLRQVTSLAPAVPAHLPADLAALRADGYQARSVKAEIHANLVARLRAGEPAFPGIVGFEDTVGPQLERALLAGHDVVLLGERGQGKTRLIRSLTALLDEWVPVVRGCEINDDPTEPICARCRRLAAELGDDLPVDWRHRSERFGEKLATPDTSVGDLVGDVDPVKVAEGRSLGDSETIHFGLVPRTNRGIFAINELPDLAERIQVALLNVLEERDIQVRGYQLRLPLDLLVVASANPEDYTNRGRIITPLKDRFGAEIRTHYPTSLAAETALIQQEARIEAVIPRHLLDVVARFTREVRTSPSVDQRSGVSARFAIACVEALSGAAVRRAALSGEDAPTARIGDLAGVVPTLRGKVEFDVSEEGQEEETLQLLARRATAEAWRAALGGGDVRPVLTSLVTWFDEGNSLLAGDAIPASTLLDELGPLDGLGRLVASLEPGMAESPGLAAACVEFAVEGLWLTRRIDKDSIGGVSRYGAS
jgi:magnesium chelatase subunit I